jgi:hypothetical protein
MNLKLATIWTYVGAVTTASIAVVSYLQTQKLPPPWPTDLGYVGIGLAAIGLFWKALDASAPGPPSAKKGPTLPLFVLLFVGRMLLIVLVPLGGACLVACASWISELQSNPQQALSQLLQYVTTFLQTAQAVWAVVSPLLGADVAPAANAQFAKALNDVSDAEATAQDALAAAAQLGQANPDLSVVTANLQAAVGEVVAAVTQYTSPADGGVSAFLRGTRVGLVTPPDLIQQAAIIKAWKVPGAR